MLRDDGRLTLNFRTVNSRCMPMTDHTRVLHVCCAQVCHSVPLHRAKTSDGMWQTIYKIRQQL
jgi:hypothetical protein